MEFTPDQQRVIDLRGKNILVSAAAGSGKTAVLVERIIKMISEGEHPIDIDRLLIVTFTNMAAAEMRERIGLAISKKLEQDPENGHLQRQMTLIHNAQITTIDSFCLFIIRNNFNDIGLDPVFRVADEGELKLLSKDVMEEVLESRYAGKDPAFLECVEYFSTGSRDKAVEEFIGKLYGFALSCPWPEEWLEDRKNDYNVTSVEELENSLWGRFLLDHAANVLAECIKDMEHAVHICEEPDGPYMYREQLEKELHMLCNLKGKERTEDYFTIGERIQFGRLPSKKDDTVSGYKRELVQNIRNDIKKEVKELNEGFFSLPCEQVLERMAVMKKVLDMLITVTLDYKRALDAAKREKNIIDFADMEHFALQILLQKDRSGYVPTAVAKELREHYAEILIDEYQDSNMVQELILSSISGEELGRFNRFMVGDIKQSIYRFRLARPEIFMEKYETYCLSPAQEEKPAQRIDLRQNFRSRTEVLKSVNYIFTKIMRKELGNVEYDDEAALYPGADYPQRDSGHALDNSSELLLLDHSVEEQKELFSEESAKRQEARMIARRIRELRQDFQVTDKESGRLRPLNYSDIVILLRTNTGWDEEFRVVLEEEGIPAHVTSKTGYFKTVEIQTVIHLVRVLDNPLQDIPLFGVMKSFFGGFTDEEIAEYKAAGHEKKIPLYQQLLSIKENHTDTKAAAFIDFIEQFREKAVYTPIQDLLKELIVDSGYYHYVAVQPAGEQRLANLEMLLAKAASFVETSYYGLFHFIRYIEQLEKYDVDYGEANILDEHADVVRLMSIHKSKGLEFPVCFVAGLAKRFNMQDTYSRLIACADMGIGIDYVNLEHRMLGKSLMKNVIAEKMKMDNLGEELRVLYVAMTRAREKLILSGVVKKAETIRDIKEGLLEPVARMSFMKLASAGSFLDFILPVMGGEAAKECFTVRIQEPAGLLEQEVSELVKQAKRRKFLMSASGNEKTTMLSEKFARTYSRSDLVDLYVKTTVSELKMQEYNQADGGEESHDLIFSNRLYEEPEIVPYIPLFMKGKEDMTGTVRGSAYHKVMELLDFAGIEEQFDEQGWEMAIARQMEEHFQSGRLSGEYKEAVRISKAAAFMRTPLAERMRKAAGSGQLYKEQPFVIGLPADRLSSEFSEAETILIQGIIDVYFEEPEGLVVVDYKTDAVKEPEELIARYQKQLDYYAEALEQLTQRKVKEKIIYSFALNKEIET